MTMLEVHKTPAGKRPTLADAALELCVSIAELDPSFGDEGVAIIDPEAQIYVVRTKNAARDGHRAAHADPPIGVFGP